MKYLKTYENYKNIKIGDYVRLTKLTVKNFSEHFYKTTGHSKEELIYIISKKIFIVDDYNKSNGYYISNIDKGDKFTWGWTSLKYIDKLTEKETEDLKLSLNAKKYNL